MWPEEQLVTSSIPLLFLIFLSIKRDWVEKKKNQNNFFLKEFLACNCCFGLFSKIKKGSGASFWCTFSAWFFHKNVPYFNSLWMDKVLMSHLISFSRYQTKCVINFLIRQLMTSLTLRFFLGQPPKQWLTEINRGRRKYKNLNISRTKRAF